MRLRRENETVEPAGVAPTEAGTPYFLALPKFKRLRATGRTSAFTLLEVMVAVFLFFIAIFAILELMSQNLRLARSLQKNGPTAAMVAAKVALTNKLEEGVVSGDFEGYYPDYNWTASTQVAGTNGLFRVDIQVYKGSAAYSDMSILLYRPESPQSPFGGRRLGR